MQRLALVTLDKKLRALAIHETNKRHRYGIEYANLPGSDATPPASDSLEEKNGFGKRIGFCCNKCLVNKGDAEVFPSFLKRFVGKAPIVL